MVLLGKYKSAVYSANSEITRFLARGITTFFRLGVIQPVFLHLRSNMFRNHFAFSGCLRKTMLYMRLNHIPVGRLD